MDMIKCDIKLLEQDHMNVSAELKNIAEQLNLIRNYLSQVNDIWVGDAATAFKNRYSMIVNQMGMVMSTVQLIERLESSSRDSYKEGEKEIAQIIELINITY